MNILSIIVYFWCFPIISLFFVRIKRREEFLTLWLATLIECDFYEGSKVRIAFVWWWSQWTDCGLALLLGWICSLIGIILLFCGLCSCLEWGLASDGAAGRSSFLSFLVSNFYARKRAALNFLLISDKSIWISWRFRVIPWSLWIVWIFRNFWLGLLLHLISEHILLLDGCCIGNRIIWATDLANVKVVWILMSTVVILPQRSLHAWFAIVWNDWNELSVLDVIETSIFLISWNALISLSMRFKIGLRGCLLQSSFILLCSSISQRAVAAVIGGFPIFFTLILVVYLYFLLAALFKSVVVGFP